MQDLVKQVISEYKSSISTDPENTDALFFILEEIGQELSEKDFQTLCDRVDRLT